MRAAQCSRRRSGACGLGVSSALVTPDIRKHVELYHAGAGSVEGDVGRSYRDLPGFDARFQSCPLTSRSRR